MPARAKKTEGGGPPALSKEKERRAVFLWPFQPMFYYLKDILPGSVHSVSGIFYYKRPFFLVFCRNRPTFAADFSKSSFF
jgi:hypothetical protein